MRKLILALPAVAAALTFGAGAAAQATPAVHPNGVHPNAVVGGLYTTDGTAGYYTTSFANTYNQANGTFTLNLENIADSGGVGIQLCDSTSGHAAQLGAIPDGPGTWAIVFWRGFLVGNPTGDNDPCNGSILHFGLGGAGVTQLGSVGAGTTVQAQIKEERHGIKFSVADGPVVNFNYFVPSFRGNFNEAAAGVTGDDTTLSAPATNDLVDFTGVTATNQANITHGYAYWNAVSVSSSADGIAPPLIAPSALTPAAATRTWHPGHRYYYGPKGNRHYRWIKGYWTSTGAGPSSFSVLAGTPVGP
jgi:hypothetical protein